MAKTMTCKTCGNTISKQAEACPHCGHNYKRKPLGLGTMILVAVVLGWIVSAITGPTEAEKRAMAKERAEDIKMMETRRKMQAEAKRQRYIEEFGEENIARYGMPAEYPETLVRVLLRHEAHDPDSIQIASCTPLTMTEDYGWVTRCSYRGKNAFGATVLNTNLFAVNNGTVSPIENN